MTHKSAMGPKGRITIPKELRERYHMFEGEEVVLLPGKEGVVIKRAVPTLRGKMRGKIDMKGFEKDLERIRKHWKLT
jgi:AbrB family looped-hinge helix DNA binding protein